MTEIIGPTDPRTYTTDMKDTKRAEIKCLLECEVLLKEDLSDNGNVLSCRRVLTIKSTEDGKVKHMAR